MYDRLRDKGDDSQDGFTLIELLIVIVILGILAGLAVFGVATFRSDATSACTEANTKTRATAIAAYKAKTGATTDPTDAQLAPYLAEAGNCT